MRPNRHVAPRAIGLALVIVLGIAIVSAIAAPPSAASIASAQTQAAAASAKLAEMRASLASGLSAYNGASHDLAKTRSQIAENSKRLDQVRASLKAGQHSLDSQATFLYRTDGAGFVDVLLGSASFEEFATRLSVLQQIASKDAGLVESLKRDRIEEQALSQALRDRESRQRALVASVSAHRENVQGSIDHQQAYLNTLSLQVQNLVAAQEKAAALAKQASSSGSGSTPAPSGSGKAAQPSPKASSGKVGLKLATVAGRSGNYWVMSDEAAKYSPSGVKFSGEASEYGTNDNGTGTSSGRPLNDQELTCAHPSLPFGTRIAVTRGSQRIIVIVTDRGPYSGGRVIDLTHRAAKILGLDGVGQVKCEVVDPN